MTPPTDQPAPTGFERYANLLIWIVSLAAICLVPLSILSQGYSPMDDALRHAAKAVSGRPWSDVVVLADWVKMDHNPGWHFILGNAHRLTGWDADTMVAFSVFCTFAAFGIVPLLWLRRPEMWVGTLLMGCFLSESLLNRLTLGRPFAIAMTCVVALLLVWRDETDKKSIPWRQIVPSVFLIAIGAWVHGGWYLFCLPAVACAFSLRWRDAAWLAAAWIVGSLLGATFTGHPITFLAQAIEIVWHSILEKPISQVYSATEFLPSNGDKLVCIAIAVIYVWRVSTGATSREVLQNPAFILALIGWILGLKVSRFWTEWGLPAFICWAALQLQASPKFLPTRALSRCLVCAFASAALVFSTTSNLNFRWSHNLYASDELDEKPGTDHSAWLPGPGGVLYNTGMSQFYRFFFKYPAGHWRYVLGFEPNLMTAENRATYETILKAPDAPASYENWVRKMGPNDRLMVVSPDPLAIKELEWHQLGKKTWIGRLRSAPTPPPAR